MDIVTTILAVDKFSLSAEVNPFIRYLLTYPTEIFIIINLTLSVLIGILFMKMHRIKLYKIFTYSYLIFLAVIVINNLNWILNY